MRRGGSWAASRGAAILRAVASATARSVRALGADIAATAKRGGSWAAHKGAFALKAGLVSLAALTLAAGVAIAKFGVEQEQSRIRLQVMLGSVEKGNAILAQLQKFANVTPFNTREVVNAGSTLLAYGVAAGDVQETLRMIGDISAGTGKDLNELSAIYGKVLSKGKIETEQLNQLSEAGVPIIKTLAAMYGVTGEEIYDMASKGKLSSEDLRKAFAQMTAEGAIFGGMMDKQSQTVGGMWSTVVGTLETVAGTLGEQLAPMAKMVLGYFVQWSDKLGEMAADGRLLEMLGNIAIVGVTAIVEIIKWGATMQNHFAAAFHTIGAIGKMLWAGLKTGVLGVVTTIVATFQTMVNGILAAYNVVLNAFGKKGVEINWNATESLAEETAAAAKETKDAYAEATDGRYFGQAMVDNAKLDKGLDGLGKRIEDMIRKGVAAGMPDKSPKTPDENNENNENNEGKVVPQLASPKTTVDDLSKIGLYNFGSAAVISLDQERNKILLKISERLGAAQTPKVRLG